MTCRRRLHADTTRRRRPHRLLVARSDEGSSAREAAGRFDVSASAAIKLFRRVRATGIVAPLVLDGPLNGEAFRAYAERFLASAILRRMRFVLKLDLPSRRTARACSRGSRQRRM